MGGVRQRFTGLRARSIRAAAVAGAVVLASPGQAAAPAVEGNIPEGLWILNQARSQQLAPGDLTLWIVKDDGKHMVWVSVLADAERRVKISVWDGAYDADAVPVVGTPMLARVTSKAPGTIHNFGEITGMGPYSEDCTVMPDRKRFLCDGQVTTPQGVRRWHDDFEWAGPSPIQR